MTIQKKKRSTAFKVLLGVLIAAGAALVVVAVLGLTLLGRMQKPGAFTFEGETSAPTAVQTPGSATPAPGVQTPAPQQTETPDVVDPAENTDTPAVEIDETLPLEELFTQTRLSEAQLAAIAAQNANTAQFTHILLVGVDRRGTKGSSNADTIMIATLDKRNGRLKLTSLLRDLYVPIPGYGNGRINSAAAKGGMPMLLQTVNEALRLHIEHYVLVDFSMFESVINKLGGVTISMSAAEISAANDNIAGLNRQRGVSYLWDGFIFANAGNVRLTGKQALGYARIRKIDSDFGRTNRQFKVLNTIFAQFRARNAAQQYSLLYDVLPLVETSLSGTDIVALALDALSMDTGGLLHETVPMEGYYSNGKVSGSFTFLFDMPATAWQVHRFLYTATTTPEDAQVLKPGKSLPPRTPSVPTPTPAQSNEPGSYVNPSDRFENRGDE